MDTASDRDLDSIRCQRCYKFKSNQEFLKNKKQPRTPLGELSNNVLESVKLLSWCRECRDKRNKQGRKSNELRKTQLAQVNNAKLDQYSKYSWEELLRMIEDGYAPC